ncbi:MAG: stage V sporulation protein T [Clostridiales bacterium]|nr:stage V sporulation protein T [Clostridiales bacterium]
MKDTGIVRKLDNLGRLVIPKEIRRCMRIKEGSPIEFGLLPTGEIVLCKYSLVNQISDYAEEFSEVLCELFDCIVLIGDRDKIISCNGGSKKVYLNMKFSNEILDIIDGGNCYKASKMEETTIIPIIQEDKSTYISQFIFPISIQGDVEGLIILCDTKGETDFTGEHLVAMKLIAKFLSKQLE